MSEQQPTIDLVRKVETGLGNRDGDLIAAKDANGQCYLIVGAFSFGNEEYFTGLESTEHIVISQDLFHAFENEDKRDKGLSQQQPTTFATLRGLLEEIASPDNTSVHWSAIECEPGFDGTKWMEKVRHALANYDDDYDPIIERLTETLADHRLAMAALQEKIKQHESIREQLRAVVRSMYPTQTPAHEAKEHDDG